MTTETVPSTAFPGGQRRLLVTAFAIVCVALIVGYYLFLRTDYAVLYTDIKPADASAIVAQLDAKGISHRLRDNGTTILVPADQADNVRVAVAGSDIPMKGAVGFELFNKSDMGLTDFAQKINYQRALQGEIARTIMMMDGVETARVHLAIPERALFRGDRSTPKAAVEVIAKLGHTFRPDQVAGIQQLVASAVTELPLSAVTVLDGDGRIISQAPATEAVATPEIEEQTATQNYYSARARAALARQMPGMQFEVRTLVLPNGVAASPPGQGNAVVDAAAKSVEPGKSAGAGRNFQLRVTVLTSAALGTDDQAIARSAIAAAVDLDEQHGDALAFEVGPVGAPGSSPPMIAAPAATPSAVPPGGGVSAPVVPDTSGMPGWGWLLIAILIVAAAIATLVRPRGSSLTDAEREDFVGRLRRQLATVGGEGPNG